MLKPKDTVHYPFNIAISNPHIDKSPHKIASKACLGGMNICSDFDQNNYSVKQPNSCIKQISLTQQRSIKKALALDDCVFENELQPKLYNKIPFSQKLHKTTKHIPTNPFEQILNETDTPDFNLSLPFGDEFSKIDPKSPTFSDIFTMSQIKSPQFKNQNNNFFMTARKKHIEPKQDFNKTVKFGQCFRKDESEQKFLQKMDRCMKEMQYSKLSITKQPKTSTTKQPQTLNTKQPKTVKNKDSYKDLTIYKKLSAGFKLKNHFNPSTPKISKLPQHNKQQMRTLQKCHNLNNYISQQSNPEQQGKIINPIAISYPKSPRIYKFDQSKKERVENIVMKRQSKKQNFIMSSKQSIKDMVSYKMPLPKREFKEQMDEIYRGKFKIQRMDR